MPHPGKDSVPSFQVQSLLGLSKYCQMLRPDRVVSMPPVSQPCRESGDFQRGHCGNETTLILPPLQEKQADHFVLMPYREVKWNTQTLEGSVCAKMTAKEKC